MSAPSAAPAGGIAPAIVAPPRGRGPQVMGATLLECRSLIAGACGYIVVIGLLVGFLLPAFKTLNLQAYLTGNVAALVGGTPVNPKAPLFAIFMALELYGSIFLLLFGGVLAYAAGASIARNIEDGTIDLALARPITRTRYYLEAWAALLAGAAIIIATSLLTGWLCTLVFPNARLEWRWFVLANVDIAALLFLVVGMGLLVSASLRAGRAAGGVATLVVVFWYLSQTFGTAGDRLTWLKYLGPYYYAPSSQVITSEQWTDPWMLLVPVAVGLALGIVGLVRFQRRDITA
ncbi:MAG TPA: ABC transporter permease subunit [Ktedonobacterales bacterium]|nr:ABC transporter permease subunit [Ktedonobacterales bacterium]